MVRLALAVLCAVSSVWGADRAAEIREGAARAVELIQASQKGWYSKQTCASCHHQFLPALAFRAAREHGIRVDETLAHADFVRAFDYTDLDRAVQYTYVIEPAMDDAFRLVAAEAAGVRPNLATAVYARLIAHRQRPAGDWPSFHQRPPSSYSSFTMTALAVRAIELYHHASQEADVRARVERARAWFLGHTAGNTEERTYKLLGLFWSGADQGAIREAARALAVTQRPDGGWGSLDDRESDAYSTGEALVALHDAGGVPVSDDTWERGVDYLLATEAEDGSWHVASRLHPPAPVSPPYFETGYPYGHDQFLSASAACWAVMAFARALGVARESAVPALAGVEPSNVEPWAETVLFGTAADLKKLLTKGFNPNSATKSGGTTALMMAAPDAEKMKLLLDRGAKVNARAQTGYSALMVAAQYRDASAAIRLLLDRGAELRPPAGQPVLFHAYPLFLAAYAGNAEILARLHAAGDGVEDKMTLIGTSAMTPLLGAVRFGNTDVMRALLDLGAPVDAPAANGMTPLGQSVLGNRVEAARLLIARGADVNHVDKLGMTPLLYAASIDFGDSKMVDLLLQSGARPDARNREGLTALDLAREYQNTHLLPSLTAAATVAQK
ncbi:MAG TPA: ankyrin repeat domain-containing protein [Bryobacteraceae bacterium]|nr:ankyrin repeat domain-containing protein [Bryobacteraceae bacterium]